MQSPQILLVSSTNIFLHLWKSNSLSALPRCAKISRRRFARSWTLASARSARGGRRRSARMSLSRSARICPRRCANPRSKLSPPTRRSRSARSRRYVLTDKMPLTVGFVNSFLRLPMVYQPCCRDKPGANPLEIIQRAGSKRWPGHLVRSLLST